jgi:hypothetical protein
MGWTEAIAHTCILQRHDRFSLEQWVGAIKVSWPKPPTLRSPKQAMGVLFDFASAKQVVLRQGWGA